MEKLELITKKIGLLLENNNKLQEEVEKLTKELAEAKSRMLDLESKNSELKENSEFRNLEIDDILSKLTAIKLEDNDNIEKKETPAVAAVEVETTKSVDTENNG